MSGIFNILHLGSLIQHVPPTSLSCGNVSHCFIVTLLADCLDVPLITPTPFQFINPGDAVTVARTSSEREILAKDVVWKPTGQC